MPHQRTHGPTSAARAPVRDLMMSPGFEVGVAEVGYLANRLPFHGAAGWRWRSVGFGIVHPATHVKVERQNEDLEGHLSFGCFWQCGVSETEVVDRGSALWPAGEDDALKSCCFKAFLNPLMSALKPDLTF
jgi:hypothetical protein